MANIIDLQHLYGNAGRYLPTFKVEGWKYKGTASGGGSNYILSTALTGSVEQNIVSSGTGVRVGYNDGVLVRQVLYDATKNWYTTEPVCGGMVLRDTSAGTIDDYSVSGQLEQNRCWIQSNFPTSSTPYALHGFSPQAPTAWLDTFQHCMVFIYAGTGIGQARKIQCVVDDTIAGTVAITVLSGWDVVPDNTSQFVICWGPLDIYYADLASVTNNSIGNVANAPSAGGTGYAVGNILTLAGGTGGQVKVLGVSGGVVTSVLLEATGSGYTTGVKATTGGGGTGCTINITQIGWQRTAANWSNSGCTLINAEIDGYMRIGENAETWWGFTDYMCFGVSTGPGASGYGIGAIWENGSNTTAFYGEGNYGTDTSVEPTLVIGTVPVFNKEVISRRAAGAGGFSNVSGSDIRTIMSANMGSGAGRSGYSLHDGPVGKTISRHNRRLAGLPQSTNSLYDYFPYQISGHWSQLPFQMGGPAGFNSVYENLEGDNVGASTLVGGFGIGWIYGDNAGVSGDYWFHGRNTKLDITNQAKNTNGSVANWWLVSSTAWDSINQWIEEKTISVAVTDADSGLPIENASIVIKNVRGEIVSYEDTGASITVNMNNSQTTMGVDLRENLVTGEQVFIDFETVTLGTVSGTGAGTLTGLTRESYLPKHFRATAHEFNTAGYSPTLKRRKALTTDSQGTIPDQHIVLYSHCTGVHVSNWTSEVTNGGVNYTCILNHVADATNEPGVGASWATYWVASGTQGFPWKIDNRYYLGTSGAVSWTYHGGLTISINAPGYESLILPKEMDIASPGEAIAAKLRRRRFIETKSRQG